MKKPLSREKNSNPALGFHGKERRLGNKFYTVLKDEFQHKLFHPKKFVELVVVDENESLKEEEEALINSVNNPMREKWPVKLGKGQMVMAAASSSSFYFFCGEEWTRLVEAHGLEAGYCLVFDYAGDMVFRLTVFDHSGCEMVYHHLPPKEPLACQQKQQLVGGSRDIDQRECMMTTTPEDDDDSWKRKYSKRKRASTHPLLGSSFQRSIRRSQLRGKSRSQMNIPVALGRSWSLDGKCRARLKNREGLSWTVHIYHRRNENKFQFGRGFRTFCLENHLKEGDVCRFCWEDTTDVEVLIAVDLLRNNVQRLQETRQQIVMDPPPHLCFFKVLLQDFRHKLLLPKEFVATLAERNEIMEGEVIIQNSIVGSHQYKWQVNVGVVSDGEHEQQQHLSSTTTIGTNAALSRKYFFGKGWEQLVEVHQLEIGYFIVFEYVGEMVFHLVRIFDHSGCEKFVNPPSDDIPDHPKEPIIEMQQQQLMEIRTPEVEYMQVGRSIKSQVIDVEEYKSKKLAVKNETFHCEHKQTSMMVATPDKKKEMIRKRKTRPECGSSNKFEKTITFNHLLGKTRLIIPSSFESSRYLDGKSSVKLINIGDGRSWIVRVYREQRRFSLGVGFVKFCSENKLQEGDLCRFRLLQSSCCCSDDATETTTVAHVDILRVQSQD